MKQIKCSCNKILVKAEGTATCSQAIGLLARLVLCKDHMQNLSYNGLVGTKPTLQKQMQQLYPPVSTDLRG